jgi:hypothetical protein
MKKLLKLYHFREVGEYYAMILESVINGQRTQAKEQFSKMPKSNKIEFMAEVFRHQTTDFLKEDAEMFIKLM